MCIENRRTVVIYTGGNTESIDPHERVRIADLSTIIASTTDREFGGEFDGSLQQMPLGGEIYFVPCKTIIGKTHAERLGIHTKDDLFGGVVDKPFKSTKAIAHGLVTQRAIHPEGWNPEFTEATKDVVLPGSTAFSVEDAYYALEDLLRNGHEVRVKRTLAAGGSGQAVVQSKELLSDQLRYLADDELRKFGIVLESNLQPDGLIIRSVGQAEIDGTLISYHGKQRETHEKDGTVHYGGSDLFIVRGDWSNLLSYVTDPLIIQAINQTKVFDEAAASHLNIIASRRNYDIAQGRDKQGQLRSGVLEQSWRIGGASGPEVLAIEAFRKDLSLKIIMGSSYNQFGTNTSAPEGARVHFQGRDTNYKEPLLTYTTLTKIKS
ncbi:MAG TPA: DUF3182 family protein [Candidatus Sulfotelmatobacter sp.]|jgi:hypothetical protein|nr:DUF3182 family protein [Candidatus Sulfotelmatobacter sp.]